jgi:protoporphyrinogen oxidase
MTTEDSETRRPVVVGAGPAGLTAAYELTKLGLRPVVLEKNADVGGLALTADYRGFHFDMGGHRFFTKVPEVQAMWREVLGDKFLRRPRLSRIYYNGKFFAYPLKPFNALAGLGIYQAIRVVLSYVKWQVRPHPREDTLEQWVTNRFGRRLFLTFFKTYTEKVWGVSCSELKAEWAAQRIKDLSLRTAVLNMFLKPRTTIKTLIEEFDYPRLGPGMMWKAVRDAVESRGGSVRLESDVARVHRDGKRVTGIVIERDGRSETIEGTDFISSMPVTELIAKLDPPAPEEVRRAAQMLTYRDFLTVCLVVDREELFPDNWIYIHDPSVHVGRIQNYKNWSPDMVPDQSKSGLGLEYFCTEGDEVWSTPDAELIELGKRELEKIGLAQMSDVSDGCVIRVPKAYPVYDTDYGDYLAVVRQFVDDFENLQTIGRNGLHRYNNQDHAMVTGMLSVRNMMFGESNDLWAVNTDAEYHEEISEGEPTTVSEALGETLGLVFSKLDRTAFALAVGAVSGVTLFLATAILVLKGGETVGPNLVLLSQYFPGYTVTPVGSLLGLLYGFMAGVAGGWLFALVRNGMMALSSTAIRRRAEWRALRKLLDYV